MGGLTSAVRPLAQGLPLSRTGEPGLILPDACGQQALGGASREGDPLWAAFFFKRGLEAGVPYMEARWAQSLGFGAG